MANSIRVPWAVLFVVALVSLLILCWMQLWFGYLSRFRDSIRVLLSNTFRITLENAYKALLLALLSSCAVGGTVLCVLLLSPLLLLIPGIYIMISLWLQRWIFGKYTEAEAACQEKN